MRISRRRFMKNSVCGSVAAAASLHVPAGKGMAAFPTTQADRVRFGVNYVPRKRWWYCWLDWDQQAIIEDLQAVRGLGLDHVRIQCLWPIFQPGISSISDAALENLQSLLDAADKADLDVEVTVLNGWMGLQFLPAWVSPLKPHPGQSGKGNMFTDREVIDAEKLLFQRLAKAVGQHRRFLGFDIGNELGVLQGMSNPVTSEQADAWATEILAHCEAIAPGKFHVNGVDHTHWFADVRLQQAKPGDHRPGDGRARPGSLGGRSGPLQVFGRRPVARCGVHGRTRLCLSHRFAPPCLDGGK